MKTPSLTAVQIGGKWTVPYIGDDAGPAKDAYSAAVNGTEAEAAILFIRPGFERRWKAEVKPSVPAPAAPALKPAKATKKEA